MIGVYSEQDAAPGALNKAYDVPLFDGLALSNTSAISQSGGTDNENRSASSKFGLAYEEYGLTFKVDPDAAANWGDLSGRSEEPTSGLQSLMRISYAVFC